MTKLIVTLTALLISSISFADVVLEKTASLSSGSATTVRVTSCQNSYNSASLEAVPFLISLARLTSRIETPACKAAIAAYYEYNPLASQYLDFEIANYSDDNIQVAHSAPNGKICFSKFVGYLKSHCEVNVSEDNK